MNATGQPGDPEQVRCCIAGGGPAGMMLGLLLARAGVEIMVLEKHADFLRDFRGDTIHPSTLDLMYELGVLNEFLARPHQEYRQVRGQFGDVDFGAADFTHLPVHHKVLAFMPQWDFLNFVQEQGGRYPTFHLQMQAEVTDLIDEAGRVAGVRGMTPDGPFEVRADLVVGADGRDSTVRARAGLPLQEFGVPIDVLWLRLARRPEDGEHSLGYIDHGRALVLIDRGDYWQCAYLIRKGAYEDIQRRGLGFFPDEIVAVAPFLWDRVGELQDWDDIKLLTVTVNRLRQWHRPGLLCIGDAAHAISPLGGVGINLAIQDAVAAANLLAARLLEGAVTDPDLHKVQERRMFPTVVIQRLQVVIQDWLVRNLLGRPVNSPLPWLAQLLRWLPPARWLPGYLIGIGVRPEHIQTPDVFTAAQRIA